jgi:nicotinate-nucleotide--dimethylbenzimidazole phosphoribosyltransferase
MANASDHLDALTKPPGSLGRLEELVIWLAGVSGRVAPPVDQPVVVIAAADHGVALAHGVSAYPREVTAQMVGNFLAGGAAISALAAAARAEVVVIDVGVASPIPRVEPRAGTRCVTAPVAAGTRDMTLGPAMTPDEVERGLDAGFATAEGEIARGANVIAIGEMGIGNTTAASAIVAVMSERPVHEVTGRGTGVDEAGWGRKVAAIDRALEVNHPPTADPVAVLGAVGGLEIAALVGVIAAAASRSVPVVLDGFITSAAALIACGLNPSVAERLLAAHRSAEPGHAVALERLGLRPLLDLDMRLGEGSGAALAITLLAAATRVRDEMATFESAGVSGRASDPPSNAAPPNGSPGAPATQTTRATLRR